MSHCNKEIPLCFLFILSAFLPCSLIAINLFSISIVLLFPECQKYIQVVYKLIRLICFIKHNSLEFLQLVVCIIPYYFWVLFHSVDFPVCLTIHSLMDIWVVPVWLLWRELLKIFLYRVVCECNFSFFWNRYPGVWFWGHIISAKTSKLLSTVAVSFNYPTSMYEGQAPLHPWQHLVLLPFFISATLIFQHWYLIVILIFIT